MSLDRMRWEQLIYGQTSFEIELSREDDGRWVGIVEALPGCMAYGATAEEAAEKVKALALEVLG